jgi:hypothetical protein
VCPQTNGGSICIGGACQCFDSGNKDCSGSCVDTQNDAHNCGSCGNNITGTPPGVCTGGHDCMPNNAGDCGGSDAYCCDFPTNRCVPKLPAGSGYQCEPA